MTSKKFVFHLDICHGQLRSNWDKLILVKKARLFQAKSVAAQLSSSQTLGIALEGKFKINSINN